MLVTQMNQSKKVTILAALNCVHYENHSATSPVVTFLSPEALTRVEIAVAEHSPRAPVGSLQITKSFPNVAGVF